jgi:energy-coupling factor transport system permease protein
MTQTQSILLGQYRPLDSYLHRLDTRAKLVPVVAVMVFGLLTDSALFYVTVLVALAAALASSKVDWRTILRNFRPALILVAVTALFHILFTKGDDAPLVTILGLDVYTTGLKSAVFFSLRLILFLGVVFVVTLTSTPSDIAESVTRLLSPLRRIRVPVDDLGLILFIALRFIPILYEEFQAIKHAQMIRGVRFSGSMLNRVRKSASLLIPVFVTAINRADDLAMAIEARGYRSGKPRTSYSLMSFGHREILFSGAALAILAALYLTTR